MNYIQTEIDGVWIIEPKVFNDARGYFMEAFKEEEFRANIGDVHLYRTTNQNPLSAYCAGCIIRKANTARRNWYVS